MAVPELAAALALLLVGHHSPATKVVRLQMAGVWPELLVTFTAQRGRALRELVDRDGDGELDEREAAHLDGVLAERAAFALSLRIDGLAAPVTFEIERSTSAEGPDRRLALALRGKAELPLLCGWHRVRFSDRLPHGGTITLIWPDHTTRPLNEGGQAERWLWLCDARG